MTIEQQVRELKQAQKRQSRVIAVLCVALILIVGAGAAFAELVDLVCNTLAIKDKDGKTRTSFESNGDAKIGGSLTIDGEIKSPKVTAITNRLANLETELKTVSKITARFEDIEPEIKKQHFVTRYKSEKPEFGPYTYELKDLGGSGLYELTLTITNPDGRLAAMHCLVYVDASDPRKPRSWVFCESQSKTSTPGFEVKRAAETDKGVTPPSTGIEASWSGGRYLTILSRRIY